MLEILRLFAEFDIQDCLWWCFPAGQDAPKFLVNCNDLFYWATADAEEVTVESLPELRKAIEECLAIDPVVGALDGVNLYAARRRKTRPQNCCYPESKALWPLFDAAGPERTDDSTKRREGHDA
jgi:hypothetical protein